MSQGGLFPQWRPITKRALDLFGRWGDPRTNLRSMMDSIIPVIVVDTFRGDEEGSVFGISAFASGGPANQNPSVNFFSADNDWELLQITSWEVKFDGGIQTRLIQDHIFTPIAPYNPAETVSPVGFFAPGMLNNRSFTLGSVRALGGYNPVNPPFIGATFLGPFISNTNRSSVVPFGHETGIVGLPIRVYRNVTLTFQFVGTLVPGERVDMDVAIIYRERPKVSA